MDIQAESMGTHCTIRIRGKITFEHCTDLQGRIDAAVGADTRQVTVDFKEVPFIDSSGIGEILRLYRLMRERNGDVTLANPNNKLRTLFTIYRFDKFMKICGESEIPANVPLR
ncbi:MAG: STAS domain-containing protein [Acidobacteria bacterium]|nr:STAS domain-containing protein [Acidobacteriota bacterium]